MKVFLIIIIIKFLEVHNSSRADEGTVQTSQKKTPNKQTDMTALYTPAKYKVWLETQLVI